jgi:hypothetical protein
MIKVGKTEKPKISDELAELGFYARFTESASYLPSFAPPSSRTQQSPPPSRPHQHLRVRLRCVPYLRAPSPRIPRAVSPAPRLSLRHAHTLRQPRPARACLARGRPHPDAQLAAVRRGDAAQRGAFRWESGVGTQARAAAWTRMGSGFRGSGWWAKSSALVRVSGLLEFGL